MLIACPELLLWSDVIMPSEVLDKPLRSRERAAVDIAVTALRQIRRNQPGSPEAKAARVALEKIGALVPEAAE